MDIVSFFQSLDPNQVALGALVTTMVMGILMGWVVPRSVLRDRMSDKDTQIQDLGEERDDWKAAFHDSEKGRRELEKQNADLLEAGRATTRLLESMRNYMERSTPTHAPPSERPSSKEIEG